MTREWAATNTLREALLGKALEYNPRGQDLLTEEATALALVEAALDAAERVQKARGYMRDSVEAHRALAAALRAVREGK